MSGCHRQGATTAHCLPTRSALNFRRDDMPALTNPKLKIQTISGSNHAKVTAEVTDWR